MADERSLVGVDGCKRGWCAVHVSGSSWTVHVLRDLAGVLALDPAPEVVVVDIPIGLLDEPSAGGRACDREARRLLGAPRCSSVFSPPVRGVLNARHFEGALGLSRQAFGILPKVREADALLSPILPQRVRCPSLR